MKQARIIVMCAMMLLLSGCYESLALVAAGAAGGLTLDHLLGQAEADVAENIELLEQQNADYEKQLEQAADEAEKEKIRARIKTNMETLDHLKITELALQGGRKGLKVDFKNPEAVAGFATTALTLFIAYRQWKKKQKALAEKTESDMAFVEVIEGGEDFKRELKAVDKATSGEEILAVFKKAHGKKQGLETKKKVAVAKVA